MTVECFLAECEVMKGLNHPKLVKLLAVSTKQDPVYIVTELMDESLKSHLEKRARENDPLDIQVMVNLAHQVSLRVCLSTCMIVCLQLITISCDLS